MDVDAAGAVVAGGAACRPRARSDEPPPTSWREWPTPRRFAGPPSMATSLGPRLCWDPLMRIVLDRLWQETVLEICFLYLLWTLLVASPANFLILSGPCTGESARHSAPTKFLMR